MPDGERVKILDQLVEIANQYQRELSNLVSTRNIEQGNRQSLHNIRRAEAQADAQLKRCNPDYVPPVPPDEEMPGNFYNGVFISEEALKAINQEGGDQVIVAPRPNGRWWKWLLATLLGALLTLLAIWLSWKYFFPPVAAASYSIIAEPFEPPEATQ